MYIKDVEVLITNAEMKKMKDNTDYCAVGLLTVDDGQKFDVSIRDAALYTGISPMKKAKCNLQLKKTDYGLKLEVTKLTLGAAI